MNHIQEKRWIVDAVLFAGFLTCFFLNLTGVILHQWVGIAAGILAGYHLLTHWSWVRAVSARFFGKTSPQAREFYLIDGLIWGGFLAMLGTGLIISTWLNLGLASYALWRFAHVLASIGTLLILTLKLGLHMRWIVTTGQKLFSPQPVPAPAGGSARQAVDRRAFLRGMGVVGAAAVFAFGKSLQALAYSAQSSSGEAASSVANTTSGSSSSGARSASLAPATTTTCVLRCNRRCSFPGQCRRYTDSNSNGKCDLGECLS